VVVDHHRVDAQIRGRLDLRHVGDAAVERDEEARPPARELLHRLDVQSVSLGQPVRDVRHDVGACGPQEAREQRRRGDPIDVVVAVEGDALAGPDGAREAFHGAVHPEEQRGIGQVRQAGREEALGVLGPGEASAG
jgi:hypothetical protein